LAGIYSCENCCLGGQVRQSDIDFIANYMQYKKVQIGHLKHFI
jgi:hypothetical protein